MPRPELPNARLGRSASAALGRSSRLCVREGTEAQRPEPAFRCERLICRFGLLSGLHQLRQRLYCSDFIAPTCSGHTQMAVEGTAARWPASRSAPLVGIIRSQTKSGRRAT